MRIDRVCLPRNAKEALVTRISHPKLTNISCIIRCTLQYAEGVILNLEGMFEESDKRTPMVCFLSMGSDPTASIEVLAKKLRTGTSWTLLCNTLSL